ncbi:cytochrome P450 6A1 [Aureobasidium pullulans]|uniref:Cytochrome P450 6A1 n=1 Tax=Aureobasidium pullulans TaxID=5580 RepID=A0A4S8Y174_AURPU|nr:cytochrome P450 6A1 [Aureobasidium pullulans]
MALAEVLQGLGSSQTLLTVLSLTLGIITAYLFVNRSSSGKLPPPVKGNWPIIGPTSFWTRRWDFFQEAARHSINGHFSFHVGQHKVVGVTGDEGRKVFLESKQLDATAGYAALFAGSPTVSKVHDTDQGEMDDHLFFRRLLGMTKKENFVKGMAASGGSHRTETHESPGLQFLISDTTTRLDELAKDPKGLTDPFESIYGIVYQLTMRTVACNDIANDRVLLDQTLEMFEQIEAANSAELIIFPWFPLFPGKLRRLWYGGKLYMIFKNIIDGRAKTGHREEDPLQYLIDQGDNTKEILTFVLGALYAGQLNSGINAAWVIIYLANDDYWRGVVWEEVKAVAEKYDRDTSKTFAERLANVPLEAWEHELPTIDLCLRDSIRLNASGSMFRKNDSTKSVKIADFEVPAGGYVAYPIADVHLDPEVYPNPNQWDPSRYLPGKEEDQKKKHAFIGWGAGRHPCLGMRFAKLEQNIILAFFLAYFDFELADKNGNTGVKVPQSDSNNHAAVKPKERVYVKYRPRV